MKGLKIFLFITVYCFIASSLYADIYEWTDENGVRHFTNYAAPDQAVIVMKTTEVPYDEAADRARMEAERQERLELERLEIAKREAELIQREAEAERRLAEANHQAEETLQEAGKYPDEVGNDRDYYRGYGYTAYSPPRNYNRGYYRNETASIYFKKRPYIEHYKHHRYKKGHYGRYNRYRHDKYHQKNYRYQDGQYRDRYLRSHGGNYHRKYSIRSHGSNHTGRRHLKRSRAGVRRH